MTATLEVSLWRGDAEGRYERYQVPQRENQTVLDVVTWVQRNLDPTLSYRFACRVGMCGSCAMTVNGRPRWTCRTHVAKVATSGRLDDRAAGEPARHQGSRHRHAAVLREMAAGEGRVRAVEDARMSRSSRSRPTAPPAARPMPRIECINCGVCYAACDTVRWNPDYLGPAALNRAWSLVNDERDAGNARAPARRSPPPAAATPATRTSRARSTARWRSIRPRRSPASSGARCRPISRARSSHECPPLRLAAADRGADGAAAAGASSRSSSTRRARALTAADILVAHPRQRRLGGVLRRLRGCRRRARRRSACAPC